MADDANMTVNYKDITVLPVETTKSNFYNYNVRNDSGCAGGLFAHVVNENEGTLKINGTDINVSTTVMGVTAGGLIGEVVGNMELDLTGFTFPDFVQSNNKTTNVMGGLIGSIHGQDDKKMTFTLTSSATEGIVYTHRDIVINFCPCSGGLFGKIENVDFTINASLKYVGKHTVKQFDIKGDDVGVFAGRIENSNIILNAPFECQNVLISNLQYPVSDAWEEHGLGMFAGVLTNSAIYVGSQFPSNSEQSTTPAIIVSNPKSTSFYNCYNYESTSTQCNNIGGIIG